MPPWNPTGKTIQSLSFTITLPHLKGHQDNHANYADLNLEAQLNSDADEEAAAFPAYPPIGLSFTFTIEPSTLNTNQVSARPAL